MKKFKVFFEVFFIYFLSIFAVIIGFFMMMFDGNGFGGVFIFSLGLIGIYVSTLIKN